MKINTYVMLVVLALSQWIATPAEARHGGMQRRGGRQCQAQFRRGRGNRGFRGQGRRFNRINASILLRSGGRRCRGC